MADKRTFEIFSAGCAVCQEAVDLIKRDACPSCDVIVLDMNDDAVATRARALGVKSVPAVAINGTLASCCTQGSIDMDVLRAAGLGRPVAS